MNLFCLNGLQHIIKVNVIKLLGWCSVYEALFYKIKPSAYMLVFIARRVNSMQFMCIASYTCLFCDFPIVCYHQVFSSEKMGVAGVTVRLSLHGEPSEKCEKPDFAWFLLLLGSDLLASLAK